MSILGRTRRQRQLRGTAFVLCSLGAVLRAQSDLRPSKGQFPELDAAAGLAGARGAWARSDWRSLVTLCEQRMARPGSEHEPAPHALRYLALLELKGDRLAAGRALDQSLAQLRRSPRALLGLCRWCLDRQPDRSTYLRAAMVTTPLFRADPRNIDTRIILLRALDGAGKHQEAIANQRESLRLHHRDSKALFRLAQAICDLRHPEGLTQLALEALRQSGRAQSDDRPSLFLRYRIAKELRKDPAAAATLAQRIVGSVPTGGLNNFVWYLMTRAESRGRYPELALRGAERMIAAGKLGYPELDTIALAMYRNGRVRDALRYQRQAIAKGGEGDPDYRARLQTYAAACRRLARPGR